MKTTIKKILPIIAIVAFSCTDQNEVALDPSEQRLVLTEQKLDSIENDYVASLNEIDYRLNEINNKQGILILGTGSNAEVGLSKKQQIIANIDMINDMLSSSKEKIGSMQKQLVAYKIDKKGLAKKLKETESKLFDREQELATLKTELSKRDFDLDELKQIILTKDGQIASLTEENNQQKAQLNRGYFVCGTYKELKNKQILHKSGGLLGINRVKVMNKNPDTKEFSEIDIQKDNVIALNGKDPKIVTPHPANTYEFEKQGNKICAIKIDDPTNFWKYSKYLVVVTN